MGLHSCPPRGGMFGRVSNLIAHNHYTNLTLINLAAMVLMYWALGLSRQLSLLASYINALPSAFVVGSAIPQVQTITGLIAAIAIMQFSYSFPPLLRLGYDVITDAMAADGVYVPGQGASRRVDSWKQWSRWRRVRRLINV